MNSLSYLSRQFDVLASPRAPPSTPVSETAPLLLGHDPSASYTGLKRVRTSFSLHRSSGPFVTPKPKRSFSSPPNYDPAAAGIRGTSVSTSTADPPVRSKSGRESNGLRRLFFVRMFIILWDALCSMWAAITRRGIVRTGHEIAVEEGADVDDKDSEDEGADEKRVLIQAPLPPPLAPPITPVLPSTPSPDPSRLRPPPHRFHTDPGSSSDSEDSETGQVPPSRVAPTTVATSTPSDVSTQSSASTHIAAARRTPFHLPKTLVLDLDETLIHSTSRPMYSPAYSGSGFLGLGGLLGRRNKGAGKIVEVVLGGRSTLYHVYKRPFVDYFLRKVSTWYTLVIFTASMQEYADPVIDWLDAGRGILANRLFREACTQLPNGSYAKDLSIVEKDLARVCLVDNSPVSYSINEANGIPVEGWTHDPYDEALLDLLPVLDSLRFTSDVRHVLGIRGFS